MKIFGNYDRESQSDEPREVRRRTWLGKAIIGFFAVIICVMLVIFFASRTGCADQKKETVRIDTVKTGGMKERVVTQTQTSEKKDGGVIVRKEERTTVESPVPQKSPDILNINAIPFDVVGSVAYAKIGIVMTEGNAKVPLLVAKRFEDEHGVRVKSISLMQSGDVLHGMYIVFSR